MQENTQQYTTTRQDNKREDKTRQDLKRNPTTQ